MLYYTASAGTREADKPRTNGGVVEAVAGHALQVLLLLALVGLIVFLQFTRSGGEIQFIVLFAIVAFAVPTAVGTGVTLAAIDFLYPQAVAADGLVDLFWLVILASLVSTVVFDLGAESLLLKLLQRFGMDMNGIKLVEAVVGGVFIAVALYVSALFLPGASVAVVAALVAGVVSAFARYFIGLYLDDNLADGDHVLDEEDLSP